MIVEWLKANGVKVLVNVQRSIYTELADFFVSQPTLEQLAAYKVSPGIQQHIDDLLERNREQGLSAQERLELEKILALIQMLDLAKTKAQLKLAGKVTSHQYPITE